MNHLQSILFPKDKFTQKQAEKWLEEHNYKHTKVDITDNFFRFRQVDPEKNAKFIVKRLKNGVEFILQYHEPKITITKSDDSKHKYQAVIQEGDKQRVVKFGASGYDDYTIHHDKDRMKRYTKRHENEKQFWKYTYDNIFTPSFWAKHLLWNDETSDIKKATQLISKSLGYNVKLDI